jgi:hypothetical protein
MTASEWGSMIASAFTAVGGLAFVVTYAIYAPWYRSSTGRMLMMYGGAITAVCLYVLVFYLVGGNDLTVLRWIRSGLIACVGIALFWQAGMVLKEQRKKRDVATVTPIKREQDNG